MNDPAPLLLGDLTLSQPQLAKKLGVAFTTVNRWLNRHMKPGHIQEYHIRKMLKLTTNGHGEEQR